jgi:cytidylate kinase
MKSRIQLITVTHEFGAGASEFAAQLGARLAWRVLDRDLVHRVASRLRLEDEAVEKFDEHMPSMLERIAGVLRYAQSEAYAFPPVNDIPDYDAIANHALTEMRAEAARPSAIIVGHGAQCAFADRMDALHVRLYAVLQDRQRRVMRRLDISDAAAALRINQADQDLQAYVRRHFNRDWRDERLYDVQINTTSIAIARAVQLVATLVEMGTGVLAVSPGASS